MNRAERIERMGKKGKKIEGGFVPLPHRLIESEAYKLLSATAKIAYTYFLRDVRSGHQENVTLTFNQAKKYGVCQSPDTFSKAKKQLVENGLLDSVDGGGLNAPAIFKKSERWKQFGSDRFKVVPYKPGFGSKYFKTAMADADKKKKVLNARYPKPRFGSSAAGDTL
ncbi:MAG: hypothetical protein HN472_08600 [Nitrospina sp.]|nr:hypothetical protein [Nitrospina sp.]MBT4047190.1 hypothetical protein [Nitrospina sp.]MBT4556191.1 hypothetical protein [Nitrospina sp.]MBT6248361.1 hypothetical protein [Nitrospina sp.]MBT6741118.1 hypothetical protein [Nitrospina sp.]